MLCPSCSGSLDARISHGVEVDVCVDCGGVWLDRGELEKLMMVNEPAVLATSAELSDSVQDGEERRPSDVMEPTSPETRPAKSDDRKSSKKKSKKKRKKGWADQLEDIFDDVLDLDNLLDFD